MSGAVRMPAHKRFTIGEYLTLERKAETKSEYCDGAIFAMAGGMPDHSRIANNIAVDLGGQLKSGACSGFNSDLRVSVAQGEAIYYPDFTIVCGDLKMFGRYKDVISNPALVAEVLSRSTTGYDRLVKVPRYQRTPSLMDILLVSQDKSRVEHFTRIGETAKWKSTIYNGLAAVIALERLQCSLRLEDVYRNVKV